jgi:TPR repeat protein
LDSYRFNPEMSSQIASGLQKMDLNGAHHARDSTMSHTSARSVNSNGNSSKLPSSMETPHLSHFPKLVNPPPNVPPSDDELEATLENARTLVLNSNDPEMQLAWAQDVLAYCGICADEVERVAAADVHKTRSSTPRIEHQLKTDAVNVVSFLADQHHPKAEFLRGMWLEWGRFGQREDKKEAFRCYSRAADKGYTRAEYRIGMLYESYNDPVKALKHYHRGAETGDAASCYRLGMMTLRGQLGQAQDFRRGIELIKKSAEGADENAAQGAYVYGMMLARQLPQVEIPEGYLQYDERLAKDNIAKAAFMRFAKAQVKMGSLYELGALGCEFNPALSIHYNALASKQGEAEADMALSKWFLVGSEGLFPKNEELAYYYAQRAAAAGSATAEFGLGYFHEIGMHVPINLEKAMTWYQKAAQHGNEDAKGRIQALSNKQVLSKKDHENVAVSKIKSQRGSMIAARPERLQSQQGVPPRGSSMVPYPEDNVQAPVPTPTGRPGSVAPYPLNDAPPASAYSSPRLPNNAHSPPQPPSAYGGRPDMRPSSAFQLSPDLRAQQSGQMSNQPLPPPPNNSNNNRPYSNPVGPGYGRGGPGPQQRPPYQQQPQQQQQPPYNDPRQRYPPGQNGRIVSSPANFGQNYNNNNNNGGGPLPPLPGQGGYNNQNPSRPPPQNGQYPPSSHSPPQNYPPYQNQQRPPQQQQQHSPHIGSGPGPGPQSPPPNRRPVVAPAPPSKDSGGGGVAPGGGGKNSVPPANMNKPPPPKPAGPKTFDDMGVPVVQQKEDCCVM